MNSYKQQATTANTRFKKDPYTRDKTAFRRNVPLKNSSAAVGRYGQLSGKGRIFEQAAVKYRSQADQGRRQTGETLHSHRGYNRLAGACLPRSYPEAAVCRQWQSRERKSRQEHNIPAKQRRNNLPQSAVYRTAQALPGCP